MLYFVRCLLMPYGLGCSSGSAPGAHRDRRNAVFSQRFVAFSYIYKANFEQEKDTTFCETAAFPEGFCEFRVALDAPSVRPGGAPESQKSCVFTVFLHQNWTDF